MEQSIKKEPPTEYLCILPAFRADKKLSGKQIVKSEVQEQSHYSCEICNRLCESKNKLKRHLNLHEKQVQCSTCLKFVSEAHMRKHLDLHELKKQPPKFKCHICQRAFFLRKHLLSHIKEHSRFFECDYCGIVKKKKQIFVDHLTKHIHHEKFKCQICLKTFSAIGQLNIHIKRVHSGLKFSCEKCDKKFKSRAGMTRHLQVHAERIKCHICSEFFSANSVANHVKMHEAKKQEAKFHCHLCPRKFYLKSLLQSHLNTHMKPFKCSLCGKKFALKVYLRDHLAIHAQPDIFKCKYCFEKQTSNKCLRRHEQRCLRGFYRCDQCPFEHQSKNKLLYHIIKHRKHKNKSKCRNCSFVAETKMEVRKHRHKDHNRRYCAQCDRTFHSKAWFEIHKSNHEKLSGNKCRICGIVLKNFSYLNRHMRFHKQNPDQDLSAKCEICQRKFSTRRLKIRHIKQVHQRSQKCSCDQCGKVLLNKSTMASHMINTHSKTPREHFKCDKCSKDYLSKLGLRSHEATQCGKLTFKCNVCGRSLASKHGLNKHLKIHLSKPKAKLNFSRKNPVKCHKCGKIFASKKTFENHLKTIHDENTSRLTFICDKCGGKFPSQENLLQHLKKQIEMRNSIRPLSISVEPLSENNERPKRRLNRGRRKT